MKIAWAFEPEGINTKQLKAMDTLINSLSKSGETRELVHVECEIYPGMVSPFAPVLPYINQRDVTAEIEKKLKSARIQVPKERRHLVDLPFASVTQTADETLKAAAKVGCDTLALFTHGRRGIDRFLLGSFAETVIHRSKLDLLLMSPWALSSGQVKKILFLDDFSKESRGHLGRVLDLCREKRAELVVFHYPHAVYDWSFDDENPMVVRYRNEVDRRAVATGDLCHRAGVRAEVIVKGGMSTISDAAFRLAKKHGADLIVVAAKMGRVGALLGGSVTRQIIRRSPVPVLVLKARPRRAKSNAKSRREPRTSRLPNQTRFEAHP